MKKILVALLALFMCFNSFTAYAAEFKVDENGNRYLEEWLNEEGKIKLHELPYERSGRVIWTEINKFKKDIPELKFWGVDANPVTGTVTYPNIDDVTLGDFDLQWLFTPVDDRYETKSGVIHFYVWPEDTEEQKGKMPEPEVEEVEEPTFPSLTATTVLLESRTAYDINLNNKITGAKYRWTSSDPAIVEVNAKNGKIKAIKPGKATITCEITAPDGNVQELTSIVTVGYDENAPVLTETVLDLEIGDKFDINLENKIAKSKYRWVSSDRNVVKVNSSNGKVTAVGDGEAYVTCTITTPENQVIILRCDISVTEQVIE